MKPRFSLRTALIVVAILAFLLYWRTRPTKIAADFQRAIRSSAFERTDALLVRTKVTPEFTRMFQAAERLEVKVHFDEPTINEWLAGRRTGHFSAIAKVDRYVIAREGSLVATATGVNVGSQRESRTDLPTFGFLQ